MTPAFYETIKTFFSYSEDLFFRMADVLGGRHLNLVQLFPPAVETKSDHMTFVHSSGKL